MIFSSRLRALIEERDLTQRQLARDLNMAPSTVGGYVQGSSEPDFETLIMLAKFFDVSADYLLGLGTGSAANFPEEELLRLFRSMTAEQRGIFIEQGKVFIRVNHKEYES